MYPSVILNMTACLVALNDESKSPKIDFSGKDLKVSTRQAIKVKLKGWTSSVKIDFKILMDFLDDGLEVKAIGAKIKVTK